MTRKRLFRNAQSGRYECGTINKDGSLRVGSGDPDVTEDFVSLVITAYLELVSEDQQEERLIPLLTAQHLVDKIAREAGLETIWNDTRAQDLKQWLGVAIGVVKERGTNE